MHSQHKQVYCLLLSMKSISNPHLSAEVVSPRAATLAIPTSHRSSADSGLHNLSDSSFQACMHEHTCLSNILHRKCWCTLMMSTFYGAIQPNQKSGAAVQCCLEAHVNSRTSPKSPGSGKCTPGPGELPPPLLSVRWRPVSVACRGQTSVGRIRYHQPLSALYPSAHMHTRHPASCILSSDNDVHQNILDCNYRTASLRWHMIYKLLKEFQILVQPRVKTHEPRGHRSTCRMSAVAARASV
jgi:hypothetical protein